MAGEVSEPRKGLVLSVYRNAELDDCTNGGISATHSRVTVTGVQHAWDHALRSFVELLPEEAQVFAPSERAPEVTLVIRDNGIVRWLHLEPVERPPPGRTGYMAGGNYAASSDSRWSDICGQHGSAVPIHDRSEGPPSSDKWG